MPEQSTVPELQRLRELSQDAYDAILDALALADDALDPGIVEPARQPIAALLGKDDSGQDYGHTGSPLQQAVADLSEQFVFYVAGVTPEHLRPLEEALSLQELHTLIKALYTLDMGYRLRLLHRGLFGSGEGPLAPLPRRTPEDGRTMDSALKETWRLATVLADAEVDDPETIEFLRLRCAWYHQCHT